MQGSDSGSMSGSGDKSSPDDDIPTPDVCKAKILALLRYVSSIKAVLARQRLPDQCNIIVHFCHFTGELENKRMT